MTNIELLAIFFGVLVAGELALLGLVLFLRTRGTCYRKCIWNMETDREDDGRWIVEIPAIPGVIVYGATEEEAKQRAYALTLRVLADNTETRRK